MNGPRDGSMLLHAGVIACTAILGVIDYVTGHELNFFVFYFIPVSFAGYRFGLGAALVASMLAALTWAVSDQLSPREYSSPLFAVWNTLIRLASFLCIGASLARIRVLHDRQQATAQALRKTLAELRVLEGLLPICSYCKKIREHDGSWQQLETYITEHSEALFSHGICPACRERLLAEAGPPGGPTKETPSAAP